MACRCLAMNSARSAAASNVVSNLAAFIWPPTRWLGDGCQGRAARQIGPRGSDLVAGRTTPDQSAPNVREVADLTRNLERANRFELSTPTLAREGCTRSRWVRQVCTRQREECCWRGSLHRPRPVSLVVRLRQENSAVC